MRIMIVDDEVIIRTGLAKVIKWDELGLELLVPAASAEEAMERIPSERPNILLTDIRMTGKTGLQLAEEARQVLPDLEVIILSGYDDFTYTQQAIRQEVGDYLLKTSKPEEIIKTVLRAKQRVEERRAASSQELFKSKEARDRMFERWVIEGDTDDLCPELQKVFLARLEEPFTSFDGSDRYQVILITAEGWEESPSSGALLLFAVENMLRELLPCETLIQKKRIVMAIRADERQNASLRQWSSYLAKIQAMLKCNLFLAVGKQVEKPEALHESFAAAEYTLGYEGLVNQQVLDYADIAQRKGGKTVCTQEEERELSSILLEGDAVKLKGWVQQFIQSQLDDPQMTLESLEASVRSAALSAHRWLERVLTATGRGNTPEDGALHFQFQLRAFPRDALFQHLYSVMKLYHTRLAEGQATHAQKAMAYIEEHLGSDVGLQQVAKHVHLHPSHLSEVFKKETGMTFGDFVTKQRIRRAMQILTMSPAKVSEIAAEVGYEDVKYFGQLFKKITGKTPSEYREDKGRENR
ncbi:response regulator transcription factor [Paenibacillus cremeus]|uniref:Helix-turn-helix domain-containing protein n=1 Tax=Paenibacillus cremeus TaxID=2163881 RepID=A0A559K666_9BACL|nr:helix-turn-helix domain-containing protein [Paenibacillus cremeus]TVY07638.1 helix-turn-helix domain-containing protein [Paenibacillus cremeus]